jgi:3-hydroxymyristoyl/3-hydroxydecanoyl-(acyl carrier protein) dehydratase
MKDLDLPLSAIELIPHRETMLFLTELSEYWPGYASSRLTVQKENVLVDNNGILDPLAFVEFLAQLAAAHSGYKARSEDSKDRNGFLVGARDFNNFNTVNAGDDLVLKLRKTSEISQVSSMEGKIYRNDECVADGSISVWEQEESDSRQPETSRDPAVTRPENHGTGDSAQLEMLAKSSALHRAIIDSLYTFETARPEHEARGGFFFEKTFAGFRGHFPGCPILPGVIMLKTGLVLCELVLGKRLVSRGLHRAKFARPVFPNELITTEIKIKQHLDEYDLAIRILRDDILVSSFSLRARELERP